VNCDEFVELVTAYLEDALTPEAAQAHVARMHRAGTRIVTGTDGGIATAKPYAPRERRVDMIRAMLRTARSIARVARAISMKRGS